MAAYSQKKLEEIRARNAGRTTGGGVANPRDTANKGALIANPRDNQSFAQKEAARMRSMNVTGGQSDRSALIAEARKQYGDGKVNTYGNEGTGRTGYTEGGKQVGIIGQDVNNQQTFAEKEAERMNAMNVTGQNAASGQQEAAISNATEGVQGGDQPPTMASTAGVPGADQVGVSGYAPESQFAAQSGGYMGLDSSGLPEPFQQPLQVGQAMNEASTILAQQDYQAGEDARRKLLERQLGQTSVVDALSAEGASFADLSMAELEELAASEGVDLSDRVKDRLRQGGLAELEAMEIERNDRLAEIEFTKNQVKREFDRALDDREEFNTQQDVRMRRIMGTFGGGEVSSMAGNIEVMRGLEKGQRALEDLRSTYADNVTQLGRQADSVIKQYTNGVRQVESAMANTLEEAYQGVMGRVDELIAMGVTNKTTLNRAVFEAKKEYVNLYNDVTMKAAQYVQDQNQWLAEQQIKMQEAQREQDKFMTENTGMIYMNGQALVDQNGNPVPTFDAIKEQNSQDAQMSTMTGTLYYNGAPVIGLDGQPISTMAARKNEWDMMMDQSRFYEDVRQFNSDFGLRMTQQEFTQMKEYQRQMEWSQQFAFDQAEAGISVTQSGNLSPNFAGNPSASTYLSSTQITPTGGIRVPVQDGDKPTNVKRFRGDVKAGNYQCGEFVNDFLGAGVFGNSIEQKREKVATQEPTPGAAFVQTTSGPYGHVGIVEEVDPTTGTIQIVESNYKSAGTIGRRTLQRKEDGWYDVTGGKNEKVNIDGFTNGLTNNQPQQPQYQAGGFTAMKAGGMPGQDGGMSSARQAALDIMELPGYNLSMVDQKDRPAVARELAEFRKTAIQTGDLRGLVKASAVNSGTLSDSARQRLVALQTAVGNIDDLDNLVSQAYTGPLSGAIKGSWAWNSEKIMLDQAITKMLPGLARGVFGETGVLTDSDLERYKATIPNYTTPEGTKALMIEAMRDYLKKNTVAELQALASGDANVSNYDYLLDAVGYPTLEELQMAPARAYGAAEGIRAGTQELLAPIFREQTPQEKLQRQINQYSSFTNFLR